MGTWGVRAFDNDGANDWAYDLEKTRDLSLVESAIAEVERAGAEYLQGDDADNALAACEVLARLNGRPGYTDAYTEKVDKWVKAHPLKPSPDLIKRANASIDRILGEQSELRELWEESDSADEWRAAMADLRSRVLG
ncbi:MAG: DUF4259 domain-containing protein [Candidatus Dormibacteraeota bacterium]|nr:DUF4259 domain-containing protein [Candidatus Dormibacteraeota bacterium]